MNFEKLIGEQVFKIHNYNRFESSSILYDPCFRFYSYISLCHLYLFYIFEQLL